MIRELTLENFRAFRALRLAGLGRVNLLVGANNSGKTSVLEAVAFLASGGAPRSLHASLSRRREQAVGDEGAGGDDAVDVRHIFHGRKIGDDVTAMVGALDAGGAAMELRLSTPRVPDDALSAWRGAVARQPRRRSPRGEPGAIEIERSGRVPRDLQVSSGAARVLAPLRLNGGLTSSNAATTGDSEVTTPVVFVPTAGIGDDELARLYDEIVVTPEEAMVVTTLQGVEPEITRIATRRIDAFDNRGFVAAMEGAAEQVPLGSLGDGVHRMLAIALCLVAARGGYLLIDEIDTGLHHTVMRKMWRLVFETAQRLDVTVFATTHSYDCVHALAAIARPDVRAAGEVALVRVERDNPQGVPFTEEEISHLAEWQIEAR